MTRALIFPGQGSQLIGMGQDLYNSFPDAKHVFDEVDEALGQKLSTLMFTGDEADLNMTENTQPALMAVSMAIINVLKKQGGVDLSNACAFVAGHSLGEYSALAAAEVSSIAQTAKLLKLRGQAMQRAVPVGEGTMAAIIGLDFSDVQSIADQATLEINQGKDTSYTCEIANDNSTGQVVMSGSQLAVERAVDIASDKGAKRAIILPVSAPFHCSLMQPAALEMKMALEDAEFKTPIVPVVANVTAQAQSDATQLKSLLVDQITGLVRWRESVLWMSDNGVDEMVEIGAGKVLNGLVRRINKEISCESVGTVEQVNTLIEKLS